MVPYTIYPVGDSCLTLTLDSGINEATGEKVIAMQRWLYSHAFKGLKDVVIAYNSISILYDPFVVQRAYGPAAPVSSFVGKKLAAAFDQSAATGRDKTIVSVPVCYDDEYGTDLYALATLKQIMRQEVVRLHTKPLYRVYMVGFLPGFPYLATVPDAIAAPRKKQPVPVAAGSVGIAGVQTGIYPFASPGGWQIIGRSPVRLFDPARSNQFLLKAGDYVQFYAISKEEFIHWTQK